MLNVLYFYFKVFKVQGMLKENAATFLDRSPLFPGTSCFPLSPDRNNPIKKGSFPHAQSD